MTNVPFLTVDQRVSYLVNKGYTDESDASAGVRDFLERINFHHFLGYARNYGALASSGQIDTRPTLDGIVDVIKRDQQVSVHVFSALQQLEWQLRAQLVEYHCALYPAHNCFLVPDHYLKMSTDRATPDESVVRQILRMKEPYVEDRLIEYMRDNGLTGRAEDMAAPHSIAAAGRFPIWSIVDGLSFGTLIDVILTTKPANEVKLQNLIASACSVSNTMFETQVRSMNTLRNQVAHHARLWMRPTTNSPKLPKRFSTRGRGASGKSMYVAWLALADLLEGHGKQAAFLGVLDDLIDADPTYRVGVKQLLKR